MRCRSSSPICDQLYIARGPTLDGSIDPMSDASFEWESRRTTGPFRLRPTARSVDGFSSLTPPAERSASRAVVASSLRLLRDGLTDALAKSDAIHVVGTAADADRLRALIRDQAPD